MGDRAETQNAKLKTLDELVTGREGWRRAGRRVVFTNGHFELLHPGHVRYLREARALGDCLIVGLNGDASTRRLKGPGRPVLDEQARAEVLAALACVDYVVIFETDTAEDLVRALRPDVYVKGGDYSAGPRAPDPGVGADVPVHAPGGVEGKPLPEAEIVRRYGGEVVIVPYRAGYSTSALIAEIVARFAPRSAGQP